jgi:hypothetical protein
MWRAIAMALVVQSLYKFCSWKAMDLSFQGQKTEHVYLVWFKFYCMGNTKKLVKIKKSPRTVKHTVKKIYTFLQISQDPFGIILKILTDSDSADQGLYSEKKDIKINAKTRLQL